MKFKVTEDDIKQGNRSPEWCPVARSIRRGLVGRCEYVAVDNAEIDIDDRTVRTPLVCGDFIEHFDWRKDYPNWEPHPFEFELPDDQLPKPKASAA